MTKTDKPEPPVGVRIVNNADGTTKPLSVHYDGIEGGIHVWRATSIVPLRHGDSLRIDVLPPRTEVRVTGAGVANVGNAPTFDYGQTRDRVPLLLRLARRLTGRTR